MKRYVCARLRVALMWMTAVMLTACATGGGDAPQTARSATATASQRIDVIQLMTPPTAINWSDQAGPDGVPVTVYLFRRDRAEPVTLLSGEITFLLYEGRVGMEALRRDPLHSWTFSAQQMQTVLSESMFGLCYKVPLAWGTRVPRSANITLIALYQPPGGPPVYSAANTLAVKAE